MVPDVAPEATLSEVPTPDVPKDTEWVWESRAASFRFGVADDELEPVPEVADE